ncbi:hypothetical protein [Kitasatospora sp. NPDC057015]|uniref:hypothetical protein n=1 Tax=Kitasatospora sp. NPDC057015 TaxID=3346001 RepID=UPI00362B1C9E
MNPSEGLASALRQAADTMPVSTAPVDAVLRTGRAIRRRRTVRSAVSVAVLVPLCAAVTLVLLPPARDGGRAAPVPTAPAAPPAPTAPAASGPALRPAGQPYGIGGGRELTLTAQGAEVSGPGAGGSWSMPVDKVPPGEITATVLGDATSTLALGLYRGAAPAARVTVALGGRSVEAQVFALAGEPGWSVFVAPGVGRGTTPTVTVFAADGGVLAGLPKQR